MFIVVVVSLHYIFVIMSLLLANEVWKLLIKITVVCTILF